MNDVYSVRIVETNARGKPWYGPQTVLHFIAGTEEGAQEVGALLAADLTERTESEHRCEVEPLPFLRSGPAGESDRLQLLEQIRQTV